jgi:catechol-2,3-dioxygenase
VHLTVAELGRSLDFYRRSVGLEVLRRDERAASLGAAGRELVVLAEEPGAVPAARHTGLYDFALLLPARVDLARWLAHAARDRVRLTGLSDHFVSEALYLNDPDGHGIEIYWDRPRALWEGQVGARMTTLPLDVNHLLGELDAPVSEPFVGLSPQTTMGHVHLKVADIPQTLAFYREVLGFALMAQLGAHAVFLRRLPPPHRREYLGERRGHAASARHRGTASRGDRAARGRRARSGARTGRDHGAGSTARCRWALDTRPLRQLAGARRRRLRLRRPR